MSACSNRAEEAKEILKSRVSEKLYLEFQNLETFPGGVVCGEYRSNDPMHSSRFRRFIVWGEMAEDRPSELDWKIFCNEDPAAALFATSGIGPVDDEDNQLRKIRADLKQLQEALALYLADNFSLPSSEQGVEALVTATTIPPLPIKFKAGGYLAAIPLDPWGRPYQYERNSLGGGVAQEFRLYTLGADGAPGGTGKDADVGTEHLRYLDQIDP
jgi:general secretion pathway protein G